MGLAGPARDGGDVQEGTFKGGDQDGTIKTGFEAPGDLSAGDLSDGT
jgi:hypothetical protein